LFSFTSHFIPSQSLPASSSIYFLFLAHWIPGSDDPIYDPPITNKRCWDTEKCTGGYVIRVNSNRIDLFSLSCYLSRFEIFFFFLENV
jgi:hypothetical protein